MGVPGVPDAPDSLPQPGTLLLHQKLLMLNCCIAQAQAKPASRAPQPELTVEADADGGEGRLRPLPNLLSLGEGAQLFEPLTQPAVPVTEDQLLARIESLQTVKADRQAFKAANPGVVLADFVRWHSPRDWLV
ncbi:Rab3 GTPase-activating protein catalytic subunit-domain-containing protein, partial [Pavlovales sp. CCMP2436]